VKRDLHICVKRTYIYIRRKVQTKRTPWRAALGNRRRLLQSGSTAPGRMPHTRMIQVTHMNEACDTYE